MDAGALKSSTPLSWLDPELLKTAGNSLCSHAGQSASERPRGDELEEKAASPELASKAACVQRGNVSLENCPPAMQALPLGLE